MLVPRHNLILTLLCRHIFFLHIKEALLAGHLQCSPEQAVELSALLAQTKFGDYNQNTAKYSYEELCAKELSSAPKIGYRDYISQPGTADPPVLE